MNETFDAYLARLTEDSIRAIASRAGMEPSTLNRQLKGDLKVQTVVAICRAYDADILEGFVAAGFITPDEATAMANSAGVRGATDRQLAEEILRRVREAEADHPDLTNEIGGLDHDGGSSVGRPGEDLSELADDEIKSNYATAANSDTSAEKLDQENS